MSGGRPRKNDYAHGDPARIAARKRMRAFLDGRMHLVPVWPELARRRWR